MIDVSYMRSRKKTVVRTYPIDMSNLQVHHLCLSLLIPGALNKLHNRVIAASFYVRQLIKDIRIILAFDKLLLDTPFIALKDIKINSPFNKLLSDTYS